MPLTRDTTYSGSDLDIAMQNAARQEIERAPTLTRFLNRSQEARLRVSDKVEIENYHFLVNGNAASTVNWAPRTDEDAPYQTPSQFDVSQQIMAIDKGGENSFEFSRNAIERSKRGRQRIADGAAKLRAVALAERENDVVGGLNSLDVYTTNEPVADDLPKVDNTGANGNAGKIYHYTVGVAADTLSAVNGSINAGSGNAEAKAAKQLQTATAIVSSLADLRTRIRRRNVGVSEQGTIIAGDDPGAFALIAPPEVGRAVNEALRILKVPGEQLNRELYRDLGAFAEAAFEFQIDGLASFSSTALPLPSSATAGFDCYLMTPNAVFYAENQAAFWSQAPRQIGGVNPKPFYSYHQLFEWTSKMVNNELIIKVSFRTA